MAGKKKAKNEDMVPVLGLQNPQKNQNRIMQSC